MEETNLKELKITHQRLIKKIRIISLPFSANFKQKLFDMKQFGVANFVNRDRLRSLFDKSIIDESVNLIKRRCRYKILLL